MRWLLALVLALTGAVPAIAGDIAASDPLDLSVTIYRAPGRNGGAIRLDALGGFAVVSETRRVTIPAGRHRLRFEGVVDGIIPESAIVSGLPGGVIEKNRDSALLSPTALMRAARGKTVSLRRIDPATGKASLVAGQIVSASEEGVLFKTAAGTEAWRCSGLPELFRFSGSAEGLAARPTLSVLTRSPKPVTATVTLTYVAEGFDWNASYTAQLNPDGKTLELGGWITLANGNSVSLANARTQIVAGGLNREYVQRFINTQQSVVARCWPQQKTSDVPQKPDRPYELVQPYDGEDYEKYIEADMLMERSVPLPAPPPMAMMAAPAPPPPPPPPEQLGDLKLYRVPQRTTVAAMGMKQTRLVEQHRVPYERVYTAALYQAPWGSSTSIAAVAMIRTVNDKAHNLGLPLPAGSFLIDQQQYGRAMLVGEPSLADTAEDEKVELTLGVAPDITVESKLVSQTGKSMAYEVTVRNAGASAVPFELLPDISGRKLVDPSMPAGKRNGRLLFAFEVPAEGEVVIRYTARGD